MSRVFVSVLFVFLGLSALTGCASGTGSATATGTGTGTGTGSAGATDSGPVQPPAQPQVTSFSPTYIGAGTASFTLTVNGSNFTPSTTVLWDNTSLTTTYVSSSVLQAQVPASLITTPGAPVIGPATLPHVDTRFFIYGEGTNPHALFSASVIPVQANDIAWNQVNQQFYLSVASGNPTNANTITTLNPQTGLLGPSVSTTGEPGKLAVSTDNTYLYVGLNSDGSVRRYSLPGLQPDIDIPLGSGSSGPYYAIDVVAEPGNSHSMAVSRGVKGASPIEVGGIAIYDDTVARPQSVPGAGSGQAPIDSLVWNPNGQSLYGIDTETASGLYLMSVSSTGVQLQTHASSVGQHPGLHPHFDATTGYLYLDSGEVIDPSTGGLIGSFPLTDLNLMALNGLNTPPVFPVYNPVMVPDGKLNIAYFVVQAFTKTGYAYIIQAFDLTHFTFLGAINVGPVMTDTAETPLRVIRWGNNGLAFLTRSDSGAAGFEVHLVSGDFITSPTP